MNIGFIGTGNMGGALIQGYAKSSQSNFIHIFDRDNSKIKRFLNVSGIVPEDSLANLIKNSHMTVLAVKPDIFDILLPQIREILDALKEKKDKVFISIAAGISIAYMKKLLGEDVKIIRAMPNLNAMVGEGMTGISRDSLTDDGEFLEAVAIFNSVGKTAVVQENMIDTVIGISGSSPAYAFMYMDALINCGVKNGMNRDDALVFAAQSTLGAAMTVMESGIDPGTLTKNVCSPGGTTIEAVSKLKELGFEDIIEKAMTAAMEKSKLMTK